MNMALKIVALALTMILVACARDPAPDTGDKAATQPAPAGFAAAPQGADVNLPLVVVYKSPTCGCCEKWIGHMQGAGFAVEVHNLDDLGAIRDEVGVPVGQGSCHTAKVGDYFVEGHVPADDVKRLLAEKPDARGLAVPGMPQGSPGMEQGNTPQPYDVLLVAKDGSTSVYAHHGG
jgi:hypothetical protein